jgi:hypothetical protein
MSRIYLMIFVSVMILSSCTKDYKQINTDPVAIASVGPAEVPFLFTRALNWGIMTSDDYQVAQNLYPDQYAQYWANATTYFKSDRFFVNKGWLDQAFTGWYIRAVPALSDVLKYTDSTSAENAIASIMWVYLFHNITDCWGPIPYFDAGKGGDFVAYDAQDKIYDDFYKRLRKANSVLSANMSKTPFGKNDLIYGGNVAKWRKFGNTLWLRLALRASKVDNARAKIEAEAAVAAGVFIKSPDDDALILRTAEVYDYQHHISTMSEWGEFAMSAAMESYLKGYDDPRMKVWFSPTKNSPAASPEFHGLRNGLLASDFNNAINKLDNNSIPGFRWNHKLNPNAYNTPQNVMCTAEAYFLRAEGASYGWNMGGTAKTLYDDGIRQSFAQWEVKTDPTSYINSNSLPVAPGDYLNSPPVSNIPVGFSNNLQTQLEQIATQKWLAMFPDGFAGWAEVRRTGFPKLYSVPNSENSNIPAGKSGKDFKRLPFVNYEYNNNNKGVLIGVQKLGGPDLETTTLWWNK